MLWQDAWAGVYVGGRVNILKSGYVALLLWGRSFEGVAVSWFRWGLFRGLCNGVI